MTGLRSPQEDARFIIPTDPLNTSLDTNSASVLSAFIEKYQLCRMNEFRNHAKQPPIRTIIRCRKQIGILYQTISGPNVAVTDLGTEAN